MTEVYLLEPLLVTCSCLSMPSFPTHPTPPHSFSWLPHLFFPREQILPVVLSPLWPGEWPEVSFAVLAG